LEYVYQYLKLNKDW